MSWWQGIQIKFFLDLFYLITRHHDSVLYLLQSCRTRDQWYGHVYRNWFNSWMTIRTISLPVTSWVASFPSNYSKMFSGYKNSNPVYQSSDFPGGSFQWRSAVPDYNIIRWIVKCRHFDLLCRLFSLYRSSRANSKNSNVWNIMAEDLCSRIESFFYSWLRNGGHFFFVFFQISNSWLWMLLNLINVSDGSMRKNMELAWTSSNEIGTVNVILLFIKIRPLQS